jgi:hypothetical protein
MHYTRPNLPLFLDVRRQSGGRPVSYADTLGTPVNEVTLTSLSGKSAAEETKVRNPSVSCPLGLPVARTQKKKKKKTDNNRFGSSN